MTFGSQIQRQVLFEIDKLPWRTREERKDGAGIGCFEGLGGKVAIPLHCAGQRLAVVIVERVHVVNRRARWLRA